MLTVQCSDSAVLYAPSSPFLLVAQNQSSGVFMKCLFKGLTRAGTVSSVGLQVPIPGSKERHSSIRQTFPGPSCAPALCGAPRYKSLAPGLTGGQKHRQGLPESVTARIGFPLDRKSKAKLTN